MTGQIIRFHGDQHRETQSLLPWYLTGRLDETERARVEAHLSVCVECQAEAKAEHRLAEEIADLPPAEPMFDVEHGWARLRRHVELGAPRRSRIWAPPGWLSCCSGPGAPLSLKSAFLSSTGSSRPRRAFNALR